MTSGQLSRRGAGFGAAHEACYLYAYPDPASGGEPWTIGVGHTSRAGAPAVRRGDRISLDRAFEIYANDMSGSERRVRAAFRRRELRQHEFDAACVFDLNTGAIGSGTIDDKFNAGDEAAALATWGQYVNAAGKRMPGLVKRRAEEIALWRTGTYPSRRILIRDTPTGSGRTIDANAIPWRGDSAPAPAPAIEAERPPVTITRSPVKVTSVAKPAGAARPVPGVVIAGRPPAPAPGPWYARLAHWMFMGWEVSK